MMPELLRLAGKSEPYESVIHISSVRVGQRDPLKKPEVMRKMSFLRTFVRFKDNLVSRH